VFSKKRRARWNAGLDSERKEPMLPPRAPQEPDPDDAPASVRQGPSFGTRAGGSKPTPIAADDTGPEDQSEPAEVMAAFSAGTLKSSPSNTSFLEDVDTIGQGIAALLAEEQSPPARSTADDAAAFKSHLRDANDASSSYAGDDRPSSLNERPRSSGKAERTAPEPYSDLQKRMITQISEIMWFPQGTSETAREDRLIEAFDALVGIDPKDEIEGMLACQLVVTHRAALDCLQLSMAPSTPPDDRTKIVDQAEQLLTIYARNLSALDDHRDCDRSRHPARRAAAGRARRGS